MKDLILTSTINCCKCKIYKQREECMLYYTCVITEILDNLQNKMKNNLASEKYNVYNSLIQKVNIIKYKILNLFDFSY